MAYHRIIPRDLFNEANLLKCLGQLYILMDYGGRSGFDVESVERFEIDQSPDDGSISVINLPFSLGNRSYRLFRPLNSRQPWPLWITDDEDRDFEPIQVFTDVGSLSDEFLSLARREP